jgi:hypothetical protein
LSELKKGSRGAQEDLAQDEFSGILSKKKKTNNGWNVE